MASALDTGNSGLTPVGYHDLPWTSAASGTPDPLGLTSTSATTTLNFAEGCAIPQAR